MSFGVLMYEIIKEAATAVNTATPALDINDFSIIGTYINMSYNNLNSKQEQTAKQLAPPKVEDIQQYIRIASSEASTFIREAKDAVDATYLRDEKSLKIKGDPSDALDGNKSRAILSIIKQSSDYRQAALLQSLEQQDDLFKVTPQRTEDTRIAKASQALINYTFNKCINRQQLLDQGLQNFIEQGTVIFKVSYKTDKVMCEKYVDTYELVSESDIPTIQAKKEMYNKAMVDKEFMSKFKIDQLKEYEHYVQTGKVYRAEKQSRQKTLQVHDRYGYPDIEIKDINQVYFDPTCRGDIKKCRFAVEVSVVNLQMLRSAGGYKNLENIEPQDAQIIPFDENLSEAATLRAEPKVGKDLYNFYMHTYYGDWIFNHDGAKVKVPIICSIVNSEIIYFDINPSPMGNIPFRVAQYRPVTNSMYGHSESYMLKTMQEAQSALLRIMYDTLAKSVNPPIAFRRGSISQEEMEKKERNMDYNVNTLGESIQSVMQKDDTHLDGSMFSMLQVMANFTNDIGANPTSSFSSTPALGGSATGANLTMSNFQKVQYTFLERFKNLLLQSAELMLECFSLYLEEDFLYKVTGETFDFVDRASLVRDMHFTMDVLTKDEAIMLSQAFTMVAQALPSDTHPFIRNTLLAKVAELNGVKDVAKLLKEHTPEPTEFEKQLQQLQIAKEQSEIEVNKALSEKNHWEAQVQAQTAERITIENNRLLNGTQHREEVERIMSQSKGNAQANVIDIVRQSLEKSNQNKDS